MKLSLDWIKDFINIPSDLELSRIAYDLTMSTVEVEGVVELNRKFDNMTVGIVNEILPHPNADRLKVCKTDVGQGDIREIVCGGINLKQGMKVAVARPGAMVRWHGAGDLVEIKNAKVRGVESYGMICASSEIGLFDLFPFKEDATIVDLSSFDAQAGSSIADVLGLNDVILEIDNKSMTNRPDLWGHYGIAREISALYDLPLNDFSSFIPPSTPDFKIVLDDPSRCLRYIAVKIEGLSIKPSPFKIQSRLWRVGQRPINAIVDITNYAMLATGQPMHAFDSDNIKDHITVRRAKDSEKLLLLNGRELSLTTEDLVIADEEGSVGLAGVMGGEKDSVLPETNKLILEIANFDAISIRRTATRFELRTEAAIRYEKSIDPERGDMALAFAMQMFQDIFPGVSVTGFADKFPKCTKANKIDVSLEWLEKRLGMRIPDNVMTNKLKRLGFDVSFERNTMRVIPPTWRSTGDISIPDDIMEEVARMFGYENFKPAPITTSFEGAINQLTVDIDRKIKEYLAVRCGMLEIFTYPWMNDEYVRALFSNTDDMLRIATPPSPDEHFVRSSLLPNLCKAITGNLRFYNEFAIFESAQVFLNRDFSSPYDPRESLPLQKRNIAGAFVGGEENLNLLFRKAKGTIENLSRYVHTEPLAFEKTGKPVWADSVLWLNISHGGKQVGNLALLSKKASLDCGIKKSSVMLFELDIDLLKPYPSRTNKFSHLNEYPLVDYDISLLVDLPVKWEEILSTITGKKDPEDLLRDVFFVDEYRGHQVPDGKKSVTFRLMIGSPRKTLTSDEIGNYANIIVKRLKKAFGAELRS